MLTHSCCTQLSSSSKGDRLLLWFVMKRFWNLDSLHLIAMICLCRHPIFIAHWWRFVSVNTLAVLWHSSTYTPALQHLCLRLIPCQQGSALRYIVGCSAARANVTVAWVQRGGTQEDRHFCIYLCQPGIQLKSLERLWLPWEICVYGCATLTGCALLWCCFHVAVDTWTLQIRHSSRTLPDVGCCFITLIVLLLPTVKIGWRLMMNVVSWGISLGTKIYDFNFGFKVSDYHFMVLQVF